MLQNFILKTVFSKILSKCSFILKKYDIHVSEQMSNSISGHEVLFRGLAAAFSELWRIEIANTILCLIKCT